MIYRRHLLATSAATLALPAIARAKELMPVTIVQSSLSFNFVPLYVAQTAGYFKDANVKLNVVLAGGGPKAMTGLIGGGGQFSASVLFDGVMAHRRGLTDVRALATLSLFQGPMAILKSVAEKRGITMQEPLKERLEKMKGLRMAITTPGATSDMFMRYIFRANGMNPEKDLTIVPLGGVSSQLAGLEAGRVDGCSCLPPVDVIGERKGLTVYVLDRMTDFPQLAGVTYGTLYGLNAYNKAHSGVVNAVARAVTQATLLIKNDPEKAKHATRPFLKELDQKTFDLAWKTYLPYMPTSPVITKGSYEKELAFEKAVLPAKVATPVPFDQVVDDSYVHHALQELKA